MEYKVLLEKIFDHIENDRIENAVMSCLRLARVSKDYLQAAFFIRELYPSRGEMERALFQEMSHLAAEARTFVSTKSLDRWLEVHSLDSALSLEAAEDGEERNVLMVGAGEIDSEIEQATQAITDMAVPAGMDPYDLAAYTDQFTKLKGGYRLRVKALQTIKSRLKTRCLNYAIQMEAQLKAQERSQGFLEGVQNDVNNYFKARAENVFLKLQKANELVTSLDHESSSLLLTEVRRALKAAADFFYPAVTGRVACADGIERALGDEQYLNRLQEFLARRIEPDTARALLEAEFQHLTSFLRRLNEAASKGVHARTTMGEARQGLVGLYFFLFNVCQHLEHPPE